MLENSATLLKRWGYSWLALVTAFAIHVLDEALTDFLPLYNAIATTLRESYWYLPLPTFTFRIWLGGLITALVILVSLSPMVFSGRRPLRYVSYAFSVVMIFNGLGHIGASIYWGAFAPGVFSSPVLLIAAAALMVCTIKARSMSNAGV